MRSSATRDAIQLEIARSDVSARCSTQAGTFDPAAAAKGSIVNRIRRIYAARVLRSTLVGNNAPHSFIITTNKRNKGIHEILV